MSQESAGKTAAGAVSEQRVAELHGCIAQVRSEVAKVIVGQEEIIEQVLMSIFAGGHCLMIGVPGLAKTLMVRTFAQALRLSFKRIQFTPDLMPADITGSEVVEEAADRTKRFTFVEGPLFANMILADEINRAPARTQAALLEAMQEHSITVGRRSHRLSEPFFVLATQNPIEQEGTDPLPEAQQDRFMFFLHVRYPLSHEEVDVIKRTTTTTEPRAEPAMSGEEIVEVQRLVRGVPVADHVTRYASRVVRASRLDRGDEGDGGIPDFVRKYVEWGAGPRAGQYLVLGAKARAFLQNRSHASVEDIRAVAYPVLRHRVIVNFAAQADGIDSSWVIGRLLADVPERVD